VGAFRRAVLRIALAILGGVLPDDLGQPHRIAPQSIRKPCIKASMRVFADWLVWLVRCVYLAVVRIE
jgi:hypothetical protein